MKVLLVEDEEVIEKMYHFELTHSGFEVVVARDGQEALLKIKESKPDFILLDIMLPKIDGISLYRKLLDNPVTKDIRVGFISALGRDIEEFVGEDREIIDKAAFFLQKDKYTPQQIVEVVKKSFIRI